MENNTYDVKQNTKSEGLSIDKKTVFSIVAVLLGVLLFVGILTQIVPAGEYQIDDNGSIIDGTYTEFEDYKLPLWKIAASPVLAFLGDTASTGIMIMAIIILIGGTFLILDRIGVLKYMMVVIVNKFRNRPYLLIAVMVFACMLLSSTAGILEESLTLVPIAVAVSLAMGWDSLLGIGMSLVSVAFGFTAATFNPFNVATVQKLAGLEVFSGLWFRIIFFAVVYITLTVFLIRYAKKIEKNPALSPAYESDKVNREKYSMSESMSVLEDENVRKATRAFVYCLFAVLAGIVTSFVMSYAGAYTNNDLLSDIGSVASLGCMAVFFPVGGLIAGRLAGLKGKNLFKAFGKGVKTALPIVPLVICILAITFILDEGRIMHTLLFAIDSVMNGISPYAAILLMFVFIIVLEFFIGSSTAKAFLIVPLMSMLCDLLGVTRQSMVMVFCMADGFTNLLFPTSGIMIIAIGMVAVSYKKWLKWSWQLFAVEGVLSVAFMIFAVAINYT